jgi:hypothetical protein
LLCAFVPDFVPNPTEHNIYGDEMDPENGLQQSMNE